MKKIKNLVPVICLILVAASLLAIPAGAADPAWMTSAQRLIDVGLVDGDIYSFGEDEKLTLADAALIMGRIVKYSERVERSFTDLEPNTETADSLLRLAKAGVISLPSGSLCYPDSPVSRQEAVDMLYKLFKMSYSGYTPPWTDYSYVYCNNAVETFYAKGYIPQYMQVGNCFAPNMAITKSQFADILSLVVALFADKERSTNPYVQGNVVATALPADLSASGTIYITGDPDQAYDNVVYINKYWTADRLGSQEYTNLIGDCTTYYTPGVNGRNTNIKLAAETYIDGTILAPGEEFSFNQVVGRRTYEKGFQDATVFMGDKKVQGVGGGICQVSTSLFVAALEAGMTITARYQHNMQVSYIDLGLDATVAYGSLDMKFRNDLDVPVRITCNADNGNGVLDVSIHTVEGYQKPNIYVGSSYKGGVYYGYRYINGRLDWYTKSRY